MNNIFRKSLFFLTLRNNSHASFNVVVYIFFAMLTKKCNCKDSEIKLIYN